MRTSSEQSPVAALWPFRPGPALRRGRAACVVLALAMALFVAPSFVSAQSLDQLRAQGLAGERYDGYLVPRGDVSAQVRKLIADTNAKRQEIYQKRAAQQGVKIMEVGKIYARQILRKAPASTWFLDENKKWTKR